MAKLKSKSEVIEWYWPDFLEFCIKEIEAGKRDLAHTIIKPTADNFWYWYIKEGPLGVKTAGRFYFKTEVEYV